jgi:hypothetical protein
MPEVKPMEQPMVPPAVVEVPPSIPEIKPVDPVAPPVAPSLVVDPNEELKKVIDSLGAMTNEQKPASPNGIPTIPDFPANK